MGSWKEDSGLMRLVIKKTIVPYLRQIGFKGTFPHFKRISKKQIDMIMFQFSSWGKKFTIELAKCPPEGVTWANGTKISADKVKVPGATNRMRVGRLATGKDYWFDYKDINPKKVAEKAQKMLSEFGMPWFD